MGPFSQQCTLIGKTVTSKDKFGNPIKTEKKTTILCNELSVYSTEFYNAGKIGLKPQAVLEIHFFEYNEEKQVEYQGTVYEILRKYKKGDLVELTIGIKDE